MRSRTILMATTSALIVIALVLSAVTISVDDPGAADEASPGPIKVPVGKTGDRVVYASFHEGEQVHQRAYRIGEITQAHDREMRAGQAVQIEYLSQGDLSPSLIQRVSLDDRLAVETLWDPDYKDDVYQLNSFWNSMPRMQGLDVQGMTLEPGTTFDWRAQHASAMDWLNMARGGGGSEYLSLGPIEHWSTAPPTFYPVQSLDPQEPELLTAKVAEVGLLDDLLVYGVHVQGTLQAAPGTTGHSTHTSVDRWYWFNEETPYPVVIEYNDTYHRDDGTQMTHEVKSVLTEYEPGEGPIPWDGSTWRPMDLEASASPGLHPEDGTGRSLPYPLSLAIEDAFKRSLDPEWNLWRTLNPEPDLVAAMMYPGSLTVHGAGSVQWRLVFQGTDDAYEVHTERDPDIPIPIVEGKGESQVPRIDPTFEGPRLTISAIIELWQEIEGEQDPPTFIHWGLVPYNWSAPRMCLSMSEGEWWTSHPPDPQTLINHAQIGHTTHGPCHQEDPYDLYHALILDIREPFLHATLERGRDLSPSQAAPETAMPDEPMIRPLETKEPAILMGFAHLEDSAPVAVPLLVVILTMYFFPTLQFAATKGLFLLPVFSRIKRSQVLDHRLRDRLYNLIQANPSITPTQLKKETGTGWGTVVHHLAVMEREGLVASRIQGRYRRFFLADEIAPKDRVSLAILANDRTQKIYTDLLDNPGLASSSIAERNGLTPAGILWHLKRLEDNQLVRRRRDGRHVRYYPNGDPRA